ncbi:MAG: hypothetical protein D3924_14280 [Candidatus Electrothrix sp. AR4]|nr:hypothetical protein [Candidatus Electrothrix sp. AR4]
MTWKEKKNRICFIWIFFYILLLTLVGCRGRLIESNIDQTPPYVHMDILYPNKDHMIITGHYSDRSDLKSEQTYLTLCKAYDPNGMKKIAMRIQSNLYCMKGEDWIVIPGEAIFDDLDLMSGSKNMGVTSWFLSENLNGHRWIGKDCDDGYISVSALDYTIVCEAWNLSDKKTSVTLTGRNKDWRRP